MIAIFGYELAPVRSDELDTLAAQVIQSQTTLTGVLPYIDVVEEALCFGWIDSTLKKLPDDRGLMTPAGKRAFKDAYGYGYQVFHPTPEQREQMMKEAMERRPGLYENRSLDNK